MTDATPPDRRGAAATLAGRTLFITGASRGIGREIALRAARDGANVVIAAKTAEPHPRLKGTIHTVASEVEAAGGKALAIALDVRDESAIAAAVASAAQAFGGIDILVNNASAISLTPTPATPARRFDLMLGVNVRATFLCSQACIPYLRKSANPHILNLSPPLSMNAKWFAGHAAYTISKYGMSLCTLGMAEEFRADAIAVNSLWPATTIATAAVEFNFPPEILAASRLPAIMADAAHAILTSASGSTTGNFFLDEDVLRKAGVTDFDSYAVTPGMPPFKDLFVDRE
jgi:citronellol/citronellal dehydrogenase